MKKEIEKYLEDIIQKRGEIRAQLNKLEIEKSTIWDWDSYLICKISQLEHQNQQLIEETFTETDLDNYGTYCYECGFNGIEAMNVTDWLKLKQSNQ